MEKLETLSQYFRASSFQIILFLAHFWAEINKSIMPVSFTGAGFSSSDMCCSTVYEGNRKFSANDIDKYCAALVEKCRKNFSEWLFIVTFD